MKESEQQLLTLDESRPEPLFQQVADRLSCYIREEGFEAGSQLPAVRILAREFNVNELTVRRGMKLLTQQGFLYGRQGKGVFVARKGGIPHVLWICSQHQFSPAGETYYPILFKSVSEELKSRGMGVEAVWAPPQDPDAVRDRCLQGTMQGYAGFFFVGCPSQSNLVRYVQQQQWPYVMLTGSRQHWSLFSNQPKAYSLALKELAAGGAGALTVLTLTDATGTLNIRKHDITDSIPANSGLVPNVIGIEHNHLLEIEGYRLVMELAENGRLADRLFITNDLIAKGATRALLKLGCGGHPLPSQIVVMAGLQQVVPLGLPVTYVGQDIQEEARQALSILQGAMNQDSDAPVMAETNFYVWQDSGDGRGLPC